MTIEDDITFLEQVPMLHMLGRPALRVLAISVESRYVHGGEVLFRKEEPGDCAYMVQEGSFRIASGQKEELDVVAGPGTLLDEYALVTETTRAFTATALEPSTVVRIPRSLFTKMLESQTDAARRLRDYIGKRADQSVRAMQRVRARLDPTGRR